MENLRIENNKIYTTTAIGKTDVFEIVTKIPKGFFVWNIGENMGTHEYIPLCQLLHPEDSKCFSINPKTLKAIKVSPEEWEKLEKAGNWGIGNLKQAEKALKSKRRGYVSDKKKSRCKYYNRHLSENLRIVETARAAVCRNCPTCTDETGHK